MELFDRDVLVAQCRQNVGRVVRQLNQARHPVRQATACRDRVVVRGPRVRLPAAGAVRPDEPLHLERHAKRQAPRAGGFDHAGREPALARGIGLVVLGRAIRGRPCPARLCRQADDAVEVGQEPKITIRPADESARGGRRTSLGRSDSWVRLSFRGAVDLSRHRNESRRAGRLAPGQ